MIRSCDAFVAVSHTGAIIRLLLTCDFHPEGCPLQHDPPEKRLGKKKKKKMSSCCNSDSQGQSQ